MINNFCTISIVSHGQGSIVIDLLNDLNQIKSFNFEVVLTLNIPEKDFFDKEFNYPLKIIKNKNQLGFGKNHNKAFKLSNGNFFLVLNPDIRIDEIDLEKFIIPFSNPSTGLIAPLVLNSSGEIEDSARKFPSITCLIKRFITKKRDIDYSISIEPIKVDWVGGMFMMFRSDIYEKIRGFDERYFMYFEDIDLCRRLKMLGYDTILNPCVKVIHNAQRKSHRNLSHLKWHITSAIRFFFKSK